ncbi:MAG: glycosyl hydrolase 115 family protein [Anaerolineae bacterium]|nr:glycosyl hydrolase 115 family protein [Anaerolineae bacterium]
MLSTPQTDTSKPSISSEHEMGCFTLSTSGHTAPLCISSADCPGIHRIAQHIQADLGRVSGAEPDLFVDEIPPVEEIVLIGTLGHNPLIDQLARDGKLDVTDIDGKWEASVTQSVEDPLPNVERALIIAGSDKRGTIYGMFNLSACMGVSPWYWWADVPVRQQRDLFVLPGRYLQDEPAVKYRGIFINDEAPALAKWAEETFGGFTHRFYENVFELILRMKGNFLWPAMWGRAFYDDDPVNPRLADEYGIVIGTSHHEPMMRAHVEWSRYGIGPWNYQTNEEILQAFWRRGIERMDGYESIVTLGMRGDGDEPMTEEANIALLETIIKEQRQIITEVTGKDLTTIQQMWALYKEVQEYYDRGMRVPDDVTLFLCDDNWGNIRKLPNLTDGPRAGGYGIYYHFDYVGGPRNYKWLNTSPISRTWEQMHLAYRYGVERMWIVNVGDIKPMEFPAQFFLDYAWNPDRWPAERLPEYTRSWAEQQFGAGWADDIAEILTEYTRFNSRRKPELLAPDTYNLVAYREAETIVVDYNALAEKARRIYNSLPPEYQDACYQLVLHPAQACANLNELYVTVGKNHLYAQQGRAATNDLAAKARELFERDADYSRYYNETLAGGKWNHLMDQTHIGYTYWQQPEINVMPDVKEINLPDIAEMGVAVEGSADWWPAAKIEAVLPTFDPYQQPTYRVEVFNRGRLPFDYRVEADTPWLLVTPQQGKVEKDETLSISVDWQQAPTGIHRAPIHIVGPNDSRVIVQAVIHNPASPRREQVLGFIEGNGYVSMEAEHFTRAVETATLTWLRVPDLGRTLSAMTITPVTAPSQSPEGDSPRLEYHMYLFSSGPVKVRAYLSPTLDFNNKGLRYAVSFDDETPQIVNMHTDTSIRAWEQSVSDNIKVLTSEHEIDRPGEHVLKFWMVDPAVVLQKLVVETGDIQPGYLGPPESFYQPK